MPLQIIQPQRLYRQIAEQLRCRRVDFFEPLLREELGGSRMVVREPVKPLVAKGLIDTAPKAGMRVPSADRANEASIAETNKAYPACPAPVQAF